MKQGLAFAVQVVIAFLAWLAMGKQSSANADQPSKPKHVALECTDCKYISTTLQVLHISGNGWLSVHLFAPYL